MNIDMNVNYFTEYLNNKEVIDQTIDIQGWLHTGDLGYFDKEGRIYVVDRLKELIKYKGYQVSSLKFKTLIMGLDFHEFVFHFPP